MNKKYQVFVSSTYEDLIKERKEVMQSLLESDCIPSGMEMFPASDNDAWALIKKVIDESDYYLLILADRILAEWFNKSLWRPKLGRMAGVTTPDLNGTWDGLAN